MPDRTLHPTTECAKSGYLLKVVIWSKSSTQLNVCTLQRPKPLRRPDPLRLRPLNLLHLRPNPRLRLDPLPPRRLIPRLRPNPSLRDSLPPSRFNPRLRPNPRLCPT